MNAHQGPCRILGIASLTLAACLIPIVSEAAQGPALPESWTLDDGTTVLLVRDGRVPVVGVQIRFPAGSWSPWVREAHAEEAFEVQMQDKAGRLRARADRLAANVGLGVGERSSSIGATCLVEDLPDVLQLLKDILSNRDFDRAELSRRAQQAKIGWKASLKEPSFRLQQEVYRALFQADDPRRRPYEEPEPIERDVEKLARARDVLVALPGRTIAFYGAISREEADRFARSLLPPSSATPPDGIEVKLGPLTDRSDRGEDRTVGVPRLTQVYFAYGRESIPYDDPDYPAFLVADHVLGGHFYSRLYVALRHEGGETYGAYSTSMGDTAIGPYGMGTFTKTDNAEVTERKLRQVLSVFHEKGITDEEREAAIGYLRGQRAFATESPGRVLGEILGERELTLPPGFFAEVVERAARLRTNEINRFIARYYDPRQFLMLKAVPR